MVTPNEIRRALEVLTPENYMVVRQYNSAVKTIKQSDMTDFSAFDSGVVVSIRPRKKSLYSKDDVVRAILAANGGLELAEAALDFLSELNTAAKYISIPGA